MPETSLYGKLTTVRFWWITSLALGAAWTACDDDRRFFDTSPIETNSESGPLMVAGSLGEGSTVQAMVVDTLSPITTFDVEPTVGALSDPTRIKSPLFIYGLSDMSTETPPRLLYESEPLVLTHSCRVEGAECLLGTGDNFRTFAGILGGDRLSKTSVRIAVADNSIQLFPRTPGSTSERVETCDAAFKSPFHGGGTWNVDGTEVRYPAVRPSFAVCADFESTESEFQGVDMQLVLSTAVGDIILTKPAYDRYVSSVGAADYDSLPLATLYLPSRTIEDARVGQINRIALVDRAGDASDARGPCRELFAHHAQSEGFISDLCFSGSNSCPCKENSSFCQAGAAVELEESLTVYIVPNDLPLFQSLRDELRPDIPEIDGIIGTRAITDVIMDLDFPNDRVLASCQDGAACTVRPSIRTRDELSRFVRPCLSQ